MKNIFLYLCFELCYSKDKLAVVRTGLKISAIE
jgi:hypothetical protein